MKSINKQRNGSRNGVYSLEILREYIAIKQYNEVGEFWRQLLIEPEIAGRIGKELCALYMRSEQT